MIFELKLKAQNKVMNLKAFHLGKKKIGFSEKIKFIDQIKIERDIVKQIYNKIIEDNEDVEWELRVITYVTSNEGEFVNYGKRIGKFAFNSWSKLCNIPYYSNSRNT